MSVKISNIVQKLASSELISYTFRYLLSNANYIKSARSDTSSPWNDHLNFPSVANIILLISFFMLVSPLLMVSPGPHPRTLLVTPL